MSVVHMGLNLKLFIALKGRQHVRIMKSFLYTVQDKEDNF